MFHKEKPDYNRCQYGFYTIDELVAEDHFLHLRYTREKGKSKMEDKVGLTLACLNIKKLVKWIGNIPFYFSQIQIFEWNIR